MADDDLDFDLDLELANEPPQKRRMFSRPRATAPPPPAGGAAPTGVKDTSGEPAQGAPTAEPAAAAPAPKKVRVVPAERKGLVGRVVNSVGGQVARLRLPKWDLRTFLVGLGIVVLVALVVDNWTLTRLTFVVGYVDVPKSVALLIAFALGFVVAWFIFRQRRSQTVAQGEGA